jgi:hypothetical protein
MEPRSASKDSTPPSLVVTPRGGSLILLAKYRLVRGIIRSMWMFNGQCSLVERAILNPRDADFPLIWFPLLAFP